MSTAWYVVKVLPGKERSLNEQFNKDIGLGRIININRFVCPTEKELVVLIKPTIIRNAEDWETQTRRTRAALDDMDATRAKVIRMDGSAYTVEPAGPAR